MTEDLNKRKTVKRGFTASDARDFGEKAKEKLFKARDDVYYLLSHGYPVKNATTFVGNHYLLSERQRMALARAVSPESSIKIRKEKEVLTEIPGETVYIDGFNIIITLEVALSDSTLLKCMDNTIRDLAGLRGTYKIIDKTESALRLIGDELAKLKIKKAVIYLDRPVSNSGRLKALIEEILSEYDFETEVILADLADKELEGLQNVITTDAIILDKSKSWINLAEKIIEKMNNVKYIDFKGSEL